MARPGKPLVRTHSLSQEPGAIVAAAAAELEAVVAVEFVAAGNKAGPAVLVAAAAVLAVVFAGKAAADDISPD